ncbi:MAG: aldo/keto reductase [Nocardioidaceae bacterium]
MPQLGCGVFRVPDALADTTVSTALQAGYRLIDTAASYGNEQGVGRAIRNASVPRECLFVSTKLKNSDQGYDRTLRAFDRSLLNLGLETVDLYLIHWPAPQRDLYLDSWRALEQIQASGRASAIGVCNFTAGHLQRLSEHSDVVPAVNQVELHPGYVQRELRAVHEVRGIVTEAWSPLGRGEALLDRPDVQDIARSSGRTAAQIVLRWHLDEGHVVIPKSAHPDRLRSNLDVFDFALTDGQRLVLSNLPGPARVGPDPETFDEH